MNDRYLNAPSLNEDARHLYEGRHVLRAWHLPEARERSAASIWREVNEYEPKHKADVEVAS
jgi:hypothetical protein